MINLYDILNAANGQLFGEPEAQIFSDFCLDANQVQPSQMFVALRGAEGDTHDQISLAIANGAAGVLCIEPPTCDTRGVSVLMVRDLVGALLAWSQFALGRRGVRTVAIGGSAGHPFFLTALQRVLSSQHKVHTGLTNERGRLAVPFSLPRLRPEHQLVALSLQSTFPGEMAQMARHVQPDTAVILQTDRWRADAFPPPDYALFEDAALLRQLRPDGLAVISAEDEDALVLAQTSHAQVRRIRIGAGDADLRAENIQYEATVTRFDLVSDQETISNCWLAAPGPMNLRAFLAVLLVGQHYGVTLHDGLAALNDIVALPGYMQPLTHPTGAVFVDATADMRPAEALISLDWLRQLNTRRRIVVQGAFDEQSSDEVYRACGQRVAVSADLLLTVGQEADTAARAAVASGMRAATVQSVYTLADAQRVLSAWQLTQGDVIFVMGGSDAHLEYLLQALLPDGPEIRFIDRTNRQDIFVPGSAYPSWIEVDVTALAANVESMRARLPDNVELMSVVKADAYGHGAVLAAQTALLHGANQLAVASLAEAAELRYAGIEAPVLVLSHLPPSEARQAAVLDVSATIFDVQQARLYDRAAHDVGRPLRCHLKIDTGMGRLGLLSRDALHAFRQFAALRHLRIEGIFTHFAAADTDPEYTRVQLNSFRQIVRAVRASGIEIPYVHAANSPGTLFGEEALFNLVRPGLLLYGLLPANVDKLPDGVRPVMSWKTQVLQVKTLPPGHPVGYGMTYRTQAEERIAILPVGYADGLRRAPQTWREVLIRGQRAPLVGRVSMEKCAVSVMHIPDVVVDDEVVLLGYQGDDHISAEEIAEWLDTSNYEVVTSLSDRIPRRIVENNAV